MIKGLDHIGVAASEVETLEEEGLKIAHLQLPGGVSLELVAPLSSRSVIAKFIAKKGEGLHHLCFEVEDIQRLGKELEQKGKSFLPGYPRHGSRQTIIAFLHPQAWSGVLVEVMEKKEK